MIGGCAKFPDNGGAASDRRLIFTMTVAREINPNFVYIVALNPSVDPNPTVEGPIPVVGPPWGNGFVAGNVKLFVRWDPLTSPNFIIYRFRDQELIEFFQIGVPVNYEDVPDGGKTLRFELDLDQIADSTDQAPLLQSVQVNFLTMDKVPTGTTPVTKFFDSLGDTRLPSEIDDWVLIPLRTTGVYDDTRFGGIEPENDVQDPDLDITYWSVEVREQ